MTQQPSDEDSCRERRALLLKLNTAAWNGQTDLFKVSSSLDSSLKKNTAFIKRLRTSINADSKSALLKEVSTLSLEKYLSEIISAAAEGLSKCRLANDIWAAVELISALHQRFNKAFTPTLMLYLLRGFGGPNLPHLASLTTEQRDKEENSRITRQRGLLRLLTEFWLCGIARTSEDARLVADETAESKPQFRKSSHPHARHELTGEPIPLEVLRELLGTDTKEYLYLPLASAFVKSFGTEILGVSKKKSERQQLNEDGAIINTGQNAAAVVHIEGIEGVMSEKLREQFCSVFKSYFFSLSVFLVKQHRSIKEQEKRNDAAYMRSGKILEDRKAEFEKIMKLEERMIANTQILADALDENMPILLDDDVKDQVGSGASFTFSRGGSTVNGENGNVGIWEDEDQKKFYEDLVDLRLRVPQEFFEVGKKKESDKVESKPSSSELIDEDFETDDILLDDTAFVENDEKDESLAIPNQSIGAQVDLVTLRLQEMATREVVDQIAIDFCFLNSRASQNRLLRALQAVPKTRQDLIPFYARLIATLNRNIPDIGNTMVEYLQKEFRSLLRSKTISGSGIPGRGVIEARARNIRYIGELVKFNVVPTHVSFNCIKLLLDRFGRSEIETLSNLLESCGRFLLRNEETQASMEQILQVLWKKKTSQNMDARERVMLENAFYFVNPPNRPAIAQKERSVIEQYIRKLIYVDLNNESYPHVLTQLRKLHWEDLETKRAIDKAFAKIWKVKYGNIHLMAVMAGSLVKYHQDFIVQLVDSILESIRVGLELNMFKYNQQRIAQARFLGEMYNYRLVDSKTIFDTLYTMVGYGHENGRPQPGIYIPLDVPDDYFRIRLVCSILETCGSYFDQGAVRKKLNLFLTVFQYYAFTKRTPLPMEVEFDVHDLLQSLRPEMKVCKNLDEAAEQVTKAMAEAYKDVELNVGQSREGEEERELVNDGDEEEEEAEEEEDEELATAAEQKVESASDSASNSASESTSESDSGSDEDDGEEKEEEEEAEEDHGRSKEPVVDEEFDREFSKMLAESLESRKFEKLATFDVPLPMMKQQKYSIVNMTGRRQSEDENHELVAHTGPKPSMQFRVLTKRGKRQQVHTVAVPDDSAIAVSTRMKQKVEQEERQRIKRYVLNYERNSQ
ncbi:armadillo-type protein [Lipomyces arxii]|uniref:armadillo-type protein n=1 Tax=Lipomyces arxii TaxID=56418 RepID=UPI0034CD13C9